MKKVRMPSKAVSGALLLIFGALLGGVFLRRTPAANPAPACDGEYAQSLDTLPARIRTIEQSKRAEYTYLVRSSAKYDCPYFGPDRKLKRRLVDAVEHGTAFAYEVSGGETYLLTNEHVASWPDVTSAGHRVEGVPEGCQRVQDRLRIVADDRDEYEPAQIPLRVVQTDPLLDAAILKAAVPLTALPYRFGRSKGIRQGSAVQVRGFPLGLIHAVNTGKVVNPYDLDQEQGWNHVDFVVDALLSEGNSGSPVLAQSCRTGELQLVGMYHAGYKGHSALNVVVGIDELREFMVHKRRGTRAPTEANAAQAAQSRKRLRDALAAGALPLFELGGLHVLIESAGDALVYHVYGPQFPLDDRRLAVLEETATANGAGELARVWVLGEGGTREWTVKEPRADEPVRFLDALRSHAARVLAFRRALSPQATPEERRRGRDIQRTIERQAVAAREASGALKDFVDRLGPIRDPAVASVGFDAGAPAAPGLRALKIE